MTLVPSLLNAGGAIITVAEFNSLASVTDGEIVNVLVTGNWNSGDAVWTFRYRLTNPDGTANGNNNKWDFIGGPDVYDKVDTLQSAAFGSSPSWADFHLSSGTPTFPSWPMSGLFKIGFGSGTNASATGTGGSGTAKGTGAAIGISINDATPGTEMRATSVTSNDVAISKFDTIALSVGDKVDLQYIATSVTVAFYRRWISIQPIRVSSG